MLPGAAPPPASPPVRGRALHERECPGHERDHEEGGDAGQQSAEPSVRAPLAFRLVLARPAAVGEEVPLQLVQLAGMRRGPIEGRGQPRPAEELGGLAATGSPVPRRLAELLSDLPSLLILLQPPPQPRPLPQQGLVRDLDRSLAEGQQPVPRELGDHALRDGVALRIELVQRRPPARDGLAIRDDEAQQDAPDRVALDVGELLERGLGETGDRPLHAAGPLVGVHADPSAFARLPQLHERRRQQREAAGLLRDLLDERIDEGLFHPEAHTASRQLDRPPELVARHRSDEHVVLRQGLGELRVRGDVAVVVAADREDSDEPVRGVVRRGCQGGDESGALRFRVAEREDLFELVDDEDELAILLDRVYRRARADRRRPRSWDRRRSGPRPGRPWDGRRAA